MKMTKAAFALSIGAALSACGATDVVTRDAPISLQSPADAVSFVGETAQPGISRNVRTISIQKQPAQTILPEAILKQINVAQINVTVPQKLKVSEANRYYPIADIVWRGEPIGNRHAQISRIVHEGFSRGTQGFQGPVPVILDVEVERFHSVTEKARYTVGGMHNVIFRIVIRDAATGEPLSTSRRVSTSLEAFGGQHAVSAEARGQTQKVRLTGHLSEVIRKELTRPEMFETATGTFLAKINRI